MAAAIVWLLALSASAQEIRSEVDRNQVAMGGQVVLQIHIDGSRDARPRLPPLDDFNVYPAGTNSRFQMINGNASVGVTYKFVLQPKSLGRKQIGPATVEIDGQTLSTEPFTVNVVDATDESVSSRDYFLTVEVSESEPYVGQQVLYTWRFYRRGRVADARLTTLEFGDLVSEDLGDVREYETTVDGVRYLVSEIRKALFPQRPGAVTIPPSELQCQVETRERRRRRSFFDFGTVPMEARVLRSRPLEMTVRPLPAAPAGFQGLVGEFDVRASISKRELKVNESATLSVTLSGVGNVQLLSAPDLPELADFKIYDDKPSGSIDRSGRVLQGSKTFRKALVPLVPGEREIPSLQLVYFDTDSGSYKTERTGAITLDVSPAEGEESLNLTESVAPTTGKVAVRVLADDILPIQRGLDAMRPPLAARMGCSWAAWPAPLPSASSLSPSSSVAVRSDSQKTAGSDGARMHSVRLLPNSRAGHRG